MFWRHDGLDEAEPPSSASARCPAFGSASSSIATRGV